jgi:hypothetical protein
MAVDLQTMELGINKRFLLTLGWRLYLQLLGLLSFIFYYILLCLCHLRQQHGRRHYTIMVAAITIMAAAIGTADTRTAKLIKHTANQPNLLENMAFLFNTMF